MVENQYSDGHLRSLVKGVTWRVMGSAVTVGIAYYFTGEIPLSLKIGGLEFASKVFFYYGHERLWENISWQRNKKKSDLSDRLNQ